MIVNKVIISYDLPEAKDFEENKKEIFNWIKEQDFLDLTRINSHDLAVEVEGNFNYTNNEYFTNTNDSDEVLGDFNNVYENIEDLVRDKVIDILESICEDFLRKYNNKNINVE